MLFQPGIAVPLGCVLGEPAAGFFMILGTLGAGTDGGFMTLGVGIIGAMAVGTIGDGIVGDQRLFGILITPMGTAAINTQRQFAVEIM